MRVVSESEADIYESWEREREAHMHMLERAAQKRKLAGGDCMLAV